MYILKLFPKPFLTKSVGWSSKHSLKFSQKPLSRGIGARHTKQDPILWCAVEWFSAEKVFAWLLSSSEFLPQRFHET